MIRIRHSTTPFDEIEIEGSNQELADLRQAILQFARKGDPEMSFPVETHFDPSPYQGRLPTLVFMKTTDRLMISVKAIALLVSGSSDALTLFAENLPYDARQTSSVRYHVRFGSVGRENMIAEESLEVVMTLRA
jgi:hypothetical protein